MTKDTSDVVAKAVAFMNEAARYFGNRDTGGEDSAFWSNVTNQKNCEGIAALISSLVAENERLQTRLADYQDTHEDEKGNVWHRPTAWAYFAACRALDAEKASRIEAERLLAEARATIDLIREEAGKDNSPLGRSDSLAVERIRAALSIGGGNG
jgi:hypothetical protein